MLLLLAACVKPVPAADTARGDTAETGVDTAGPPGPGPCGPWAGVRQVGTRWDFVPTNDYVERFQWNGTGSTVVTAIDGEVVTLRTTAHYSGDEGSFELSRTETWRCDAQGAWWTGSVVSTTYASGGHSSAITGTRTFDPGWLVRPSTLTLQDAWVDRFTHRQVVNGVEGSEEVVCTSTAADDETVPVGAATVPARRVDVDCVGLDSTTLWLADGLGLVADPDLRVVEYRP